MTLVPRSISSEAFGSHPEAAAVDLSLPIDAPPAMSDAERRRVLLEWNATTVDYPDRCVHELIEAQARRTPDAVAIVYGAQTLTYAELNRRANQLARRLRAVGAGHETLVGLLLERSADQLTCVLAILKAGAAYVPLDASSPRDRLALMLADTASPVIVTQRSLQDRLPRTDASIVFVDDSVADELTDDLPPLATPDSLAYVIYTSGSTGVPKGVLIDHRGLVNHTFAMIDTHRLEAADRVLQFSSLTFDASAASLFPALVAGASLVLPQLALAELVGDQLTRLCEEQQVTVVQLPASVWHQWVDDMQARGHILSAPLKILLVGGEPPLAEKLRAWARLTDRPMTFLNAYGPTEAAITTTLFSLPCDESSLAHVETLPIGRPIANKQVYVLDASLQPVPIGAVGELYVGGVGLARGYLNRPELTAERFISWQAEDAPSPVRLYRTGDLARYRGDGNLEFCGRVDQQVKLRGFRIELGEIEASLRQHEAVRDAVVIVRDDDPASPQLVAYVILESTPAQPARLSRAALQAHLATWLPAHMIPAAFVELEKLPLTSNGKLDRGALPPPVEERRDEGWSAPSTDDELLIGKHWAQALGRSHLRAHDNFFDLGGHSLAAARAVALVNTALGRDVPLRLIYEAPTVAAFARAMRTGAAPASPLSAAALAAEVALDPTIRARGAPRRQEAGGAIFLTGATGYLGAFLLAELLAQTDATVYCLMRAAHPREAALRLADLAERYALDIDPGARRIVPVLGDLRRPRLGLGSQAFDRLADTVSAIYHAGAQVHYLYPYASLKAANVDGTTEVLRLASTGAPKPVHYVSTLATAVSAAGAAAVAEDAPLGPCDSDRGYDQSKWVAEGLVRLAGERGIPVSIYRPGRIGSHSRTGAFNDGDFFVRLLAGCLRLGMAPDLDFRENLLPVDRAAEAIVRLAGQAPAGTTFHLLSPEHTSWRWVVARSAALGYRLDLAPYAVWRRALTAALGADADHPLLGLISYLPPDPADADWMHVLARHRFGTQNTAERLGSNPPAGPWFGEGQLAMLLAEGSRRGVFPAPAARRGMPARDPIDALAAQALG